MREILTEENELPRNMQELNNRLHFGKGKKKHMWEAVTEKLSCDFHEVFEVQKVARRWQSLIDAYKNVKDNNVASGRGTVKFEFYTEMGELIGARHDIAPPVTGTANGIAVHRPAELETEGIRPSVPTTPSSARKRKRKSDGEDSLLEYFKESDAAQKEFQTDMLTQMKDSQQSFERMFMAILEKK
jgi:hypothetical protein